MVELLKMFINKIITHNFPINIYNLVFSHLFSLSPETKFSSNVVLMSSFFVFLYRSTFCFSTMCSSLFNSKLSKSENLREDKLGVSLMMVSHLLWYSQTTFWVTFYFLNYRNVEFFKLAWSTNSPWCAHQTVTMVGAMAKCKNRLILKHFIQRLAIIQELCNMSFQRQLKST